MFQAVSKRTTRISCLAKRAMEDHLQQIFTLTRIQKKADKRDFTAEERLELPTFCTPNAERLADLIHKDLDKEDEFQAVNEVLKKHFVQIRGTFRYYSTSSKSMNKMLEHAEMMRICSDCQITDRKECSANNLMKIFSKSSPLGTVNSNLEGDRFVDLLARIAAAKWPKVLMEEKGLSMAVQRLLDNNIIPYAKVMDNSEFNEMFNSHEMETLLSEYKDVLVKVWQHTVKSDMNSGGVLLTYESFTQLMSTIK
eukprot:gene4513-2317_t